MTTEQREAKRVYQAAYYQGRREELLARQTAYNADHREAIAAYRADHREAKRAYRAAHREETRAYQGAYNAAHRDEAREKAAGFTEWLQILRTVNGCADCETHEGWLEHHHVDPSTKLYDVSDMYSCSLDTLEDELEKCVVLCRPCHTKRHVALRANARAAA